MQPVMYGTAGDALLPSPVIWRRCERNNIIQMGSGYWIHEDFLGGVADIVAANEQRPAVGPFTLICDDDTTLSHKAAELGGYLDIETDNTDNDAWTIHTEPFCKFVPKSGNQVWLEGRLEIGDADADQGFFFGVGEEALQSLEIVDEDCAALFDESYLGFRILDGEDAIDIAYKVDAGTEVVVASDVTDSDALGDDGASLADDTEYKLGLWFDGDETIRFYVDGVEVASLAASSIDNTVNFVFASSLRTGGAALQSVAFDWIRMAYERMSV